MQLKDVVQYNLESRSLKFAKAVRLSVKQLEASITTESDIKQLIRATGSVGANYIEANESISKKDFLYRLRIARKEAKECSYWLQLLIQMNPDHQGSLTPLLKESQEIRNILSAIITKSE